MFIKSCRVFGNDNIYRKYYKDIYSHTPMAFNVTYLGFCILHSTWYTKMSLLNSRLTIIWSLYNLSHFELDQICWGPSSHSLKHLLTWTFLPNFPLFDINLSCLAFLFCHPCSCKHDVLMLSFITMAVSMNSWNTSYDFPFVLILHICCHVPQMTSEKQYYS